jgi:hypothetical protein
VSGLPDLRGLVGDDVPERELAELRRVDGLLRAMPAPPDVPESLTASVLAIPGRGRFSRRRRLAASLALAAALAAGTFGVGVWVAGDSEGPGVVASVTLSATRDAPPEAEMAISVLPPDEAGNWPMAADVSGLDPLPPGGYYEVWLTKGQELVVSCGRFVVDESGQAKGVWLNGPYSFGEYDRWVVTAHVPGEEKHPWLLDGPVVLPA